MARVKWPEKHREQWDIVAGELDLSFKEAWETASKSGVLLKTWVKTRRREIALFVGEDVVDVLVRADGKYLSAVGTQAVKVCMRPNFRTGRSMFAEEWLGCAKQILLWCLLPTAACTTSIAISDIFSSVHFAPDTCRLMAPSSTLR